MTLEAETGSEAAIGSGTSCESNPSVFLRLWARQLTRLSCNALDTDLLVALQRPRVAAASTVHPALLGTLALLASTSLLIF